MIDLSIIITSWNTSKLLRACLHSLRHLLINPRFEIIVVDNASSDDSVVMIRNEFPQVRLLVNAKNNGYAGGNNQGAAIARGKNILLLGSDTECFENSVETMLNYLLHHDFVGAVSCKLITPEGTLQRSCKRFPTLGNAVATYVSLHALNKRYHMAEFQHDVECEVQQPDATCIMIRKSIIDEIGLFNEKYSILYNDVDLCQRIIASGKKIMFLPNAVVKHHGSQSTKQASKQLRLVMYQNIIDYYTDYVGYYTRFILKPILIVRFILVSRSLLGLKLLFY